jgi:hypothetical protein
MLVCTTAQAEFANMIVAFCGREVDVTTVDALELAVLNQLQDLMADCQDASRLRGNSRTVVRGIGCVNRDGVCVCVCTCVCVVRPCVRLQRQ